MVGHHAHLPLRKLVQIIAGGARAETHLQVTANSALLQVSPQMADIASHRWAKTVFNVNKNGHCWGR